MSSKDTIIILASVGTTIIRAKVTTYDMIKRDLADYSGMEVLQVFTDDNAAHAMSEPEDRVYTVVIAVPVFMTKGELYNSLKSRLDFYLDRLEIRMTDSVLHDAQSCKEFVEIFETITSLDPKKEYLFVEHGNQYYHCAANTYLQKALDEKGYANAKVIQLKERDSFGQAIAFLKSRKADFPEVKKGGRDRCPGHNHPAHRGMGRLHGQRALQRAGFLCVEAQKCRLPRRIHGRRSRRV